MQTEVMAVIRNGQRLRPLGHTGPLKILAVVAIFNLGQTAILKRQI